MARILTAYVLLLAFGSVLVVSVVGAVHGTSGHAVMAAGVDCPLMSHEEAWCPMSVFDHMIKLRMLFEAVLPSVIALIIFIGAAAPFFPFGSQWHWRWQMIVYSRFRHYVWTQTCFEVRQYQALFARGILHPKLY